MYIIVLDWDFVLYARRSNTTYVFLQDFSAEQQSRNKAKFLYCILICHILKHYFVHHWPIRLCHIDTKVPTFSPMFLQNIVKSMPNQRTLASLRKTSRVMKSLARRKTTPVMKLYLAILIPSLSWNKPVQLINTMFIAEIAIKQKLKKKLWMACK